MAIRYSRFTGLIHYLGDASIWSIVLWVSILIENSHFHGAFFTKDLILFLLIHAYWAIISFYLKIYDIPRTALIRDVLLEIVKVFLVHIAILATTLVIYEPLIYSNTFFITLYAGSITGIMVWRISFILFLQYYRRSGFNYRNIIIAGYDEVSSDLQQYFSERPSYGYRFLGFFDDKRKSGVLGKVEEITEYIHSHDVDEIYCSISRLSQAQLNTLVQVADNNLIRIKLIPDYREFLYDNVAVRHIGHLPVITFRREPLNNFVNQLLKRGFDIVFSLLVIVFLLSWLGPLIALAIRLDSAGPVLFLQKRNGLYNKVFWCWKFRTMRVNQESNTRKTSKNDERITVLGSFLRKTNLDELPQFFNVLMGDMSVVGPRPYMVSETEYFSQQVEKYMVRHLVKPGITGLSQSRGLRGPTPNAFAMRQRVKVDIFYIENWSFLFDLQIISMTVLNMLRGDKNAF